ncbi:MAG TPA: TonB-dependent receptor [Thermoanaerobaculia bacterium]|nr:TonB-dependent receptor [Thermoanaerobaculia bacterium]
MKSLVAVGFACALIMAAANPAGAQSTGRIEGIVTDDSGAAVPGATVTSTNLGTNAVRVVVSDAEGAYTIAPLPVGDYRIRVELSGFRPAATTVSLTVNQVSRVDFELELGELAETVVVTAAAPLIDKSTSHISTVIEAEQVENLPLNGRNFTQLATLVPGVNRGIPGSNASGGGSGTDAETFRYSEFGGAALSVNGLREQFNNYMIDGIDNNETLVNSIAYLPSPDAIQEFGVITTNAPAEFGRAGGAVQNLVIKSGTNQVDGSVFYFIRPESLAAKPKFAEEKPDFSNEDFGATAGGPIFRDRTFFFLSYHGLRNSIPVEAGNRVTVPTAKMRNGDFSELLDPAVSGLPDPIIIYDPLTGLPFEGNIIPADRINPVGRAYLNVFPLPDGPGVTRNFLTRRQKQSTYDDFDAKFDHRLNSRDHLFFSASHWSDQFSDPGRIPGYQAGFGAGTSEHDGYTVRLGETHLFSGDLINEARLGYTDFHFGFFPVGFGADQNAELGIPGPGGITTPNGISLIGGGNGFYLEYLGDFGQYKIEQKTIQFSDTLTWLRGNHSIKFGGTAMRREMAQERTQFGKGFYFFRDGLGFIPGFSGYEVADMLVGTTDFTATGVPGFVPRNVISWENAIFVQDDWRVSPRLTLNLGLRWDVFTPYYEENNRMANYDPVTQSLVLPGENGAPRATIDTDMDNVGPRLGFNYLLDDKTALRGGYGLFYSLDRGGIDRQLTENPPAVVTEFRFGDVPGARVRISDPIPLPTPVDPQNPELPQGSGVVYIPEDSETTEVQQWSLSVQREVNANTSAMLAYVGTRADNLAALITSAGFAGDVAGRLNTVMYIGSSSYDALQASVRMRAWRGLSFLASYTLGEARNDTPGFFAGNPSRGGTVTDADCVEPGQTCDLGLDEGLADYDSRHRFTFAGTWEIPFATGNPLLGGWALNGVVTLQSGTPFTVYSDFGGITRANQNGNPNDGPENVGEWFNTSVFTPATGGQGTAERNSVRGPDIRTVDLSLFKTIDLSELGAVELRIEGFNVFNTPLYGQPNNVVIDPNFGRITGTRFNSERQIQLAVRYIF